MSVKRFRVTFECETADYDARLTRQEAEDVLTSERWEGLTDPITGAVVQSASLSDERLAVALSRTTIGMAARVAGHDGIVTIRHAADDEPEYPVSVRAATVKAVAVRLIEESDDGESLTDEGMVTEEQDEASVYEPWVTDDSGRVH